MRLRNKQAQIVEICGDYNRLIDARLPAAILSETQRIYRRRKDHHNVIF